MEIKNGYLIKIGNFLDGLKLPAQVSRARTKLVNELQKDIYELSEDEKEIVRNHNGVISESDGVITWQNDNDKILYIKEKNEMMEESVDVTIDNITLFEKFKEYMENWNEEVSGEEAAAYDILCEALGI